MIRKLIKTLLLTVLTTVMLGTTCLAKAETMYTKSGTPVYSMGEFFELVMFNLPAGIPIETDGGADGLYLVYINGEEYFIPYEYLAPTLAESSTNALDSVPNSDGSLNGYSYNPNPNLFIYGYNFSNDSRFAKNDYRSNATYNNLRRGLDYTLWFSDIDSTINHTEIIALECSVDEAYNIACNVVIDSFDYDEYFRDRYNNCTIDSFIDETTGNVIASITLTK